MVRQVLEVRPKNGGTFTNVLTHGIGKVGYFVLLLVLMILKNEGLVLVLVLTVLKQMTYSYPYSYSRY